MKKIFLAVILISAQIMLFGFGFGYWELSGGKLVPAQNVDLTGKEVELGPLMMADEGRIQNDPSASDNYSTWQATDEVGGTPAQVNLLTLTNAGVGGSPLLTIGTTASRVNRIYNASPDAMADDTYNGDVILGLNFGESVTQWQPVYLASDGKLDAATNGSVGEYETLIGIACNSGVDTGAATVLTKGVVRNEGWTGLTVGGTVYLGAGVITQNTPVSATACRVLGIAISDSEIYFNISPDWFIVE